MLFFNTLKQGKKVGIFHLSKSPGGKNNAKVCASLIFSAKNPLQRQGFYLVNPNGGKALSNRGKKWKQDERISISVEKSGNALHRHR